MKVLTKTLCAGMMIALVAGCASNGTYVPSLPPHARAAYLDYQDLPENKPLFTLKTTNIVATGQNNRQDFLNFKDSFPDRDVFTKFLQND